MILFLYINLSLGYKHYWSAALSDLKTNSKDAFDMWQLCGKPSTGALFDLMKDAKYKYKLAVRQAIRTYEGKFSDELYEHLLSKDMNSFWKTWSSKAGKKFSQLHVLMGKLMIIRLLIFFVKSLVIILCVPVMTSLFVLII